MISMVQFLSLTGEMCAVIGIMDFLPMYQPISLNLALFAFRLKPPDWIMDPINEAKAAKDAAAGSVMTFFFGWMADLELCGEPPKDPADLVTADATSLFAGNSFISIMAFAIVLPFQFLIVRFPRGSQRYGWLSDLRWIREMGRASYAFPLLQLIFLQAYTSPDL